MRLISSTTTKQIARHLLAQETLVGLRMLTKRGITCTHPQLTSYHSRASGYKEVSCQLGCGIEIVTAFDDTDKLIYIYDRYSTEQMIEIVRQTITQYSRANRG